MSRRRTAGVFGVLLVACGACSGGAKSASAPTATAPVSPPPPVHTLSGTVRANHVPVAGAIVVVRDVNGFYQDQTYATPPTELRTTTDGDGRYTIPNVPEKITSPFGVSVRASHPGYFTDFSGPPWFFQDAQLDFDLEPWEPIPPDAVVRGRVGERSCAGLGYGPGPCQRYALAVPAPRTIELTAPVFNFELTVVTPDGKFAVFYSPVSSSAPLQIKIPADTGTYEINIAAAGPTRDFVLTTALR